MWVYITSKGGHHMLGTREYLESERFSNSLSELSRIMSYNISNTVDVLVSKIDLNEINLKPEFQRDFVWDIKKSSMFIDSLLIGLPIPSILLGKIKEDENFIVIDGQQRLKSIYFYIKGSFQGNGENKPFNLKDLHGRPWNEKSYEELDTVYQRRLRNAVINSTIIEDVDSSPAVIYEIFYRLNTGGMPLRDQEIRNCIYPGTFLSFLNELNKYYNWRLLLNKISVDKRLNDVELILRYFALLYDFDNYEPSMRNFMSYFLSNNRNNTQNEFKLETIFKKTVDFIYQNIGQQAFKNYRTFNKSICDSIMVAISQCLLEGKEVLNAKDQHYRLLQDPLYQNTISNSTSSHFNVMSRIELAKQYFTNEK